MYYVVLPALDLGTLVAATPIPMAILNHVIFGAVVALAFVPIERRLLPTRFAPWVTTRPGGRRRRDTAA
jgi:hypothetical protein